MRSPCLHCSGGLFVTPWAWRRLDDRRITFLRTRQAERLRYNFILPMRTLAVTSAVLLESKRDQADQREIAPATRAPRPELRLGESSHDHSSSDRSRLARPSRRHRLTPPASPCRH